MSWNKFLLGMGVGFAGALLLHETLKDHLLSGEKALKIVKETFKKNGPIDGSWIHMVPEDYIKSGIVYKVYKGGISRSIDSVSNHFEFTVDAKTGTILEVSPIE